MTDDVRLTPRRLLSETTISSLATLHASLHRLHTVSSVSHIAVSSIPLRFSLVAPLRLPPPPASYTRLLPDVTPPLYDAFGVGDVDDEVLVCFASTWSNGRMDTWAFALPTIRGYFSGVGDLFSALVLAHFDSPESSSALPPLAHAVSKSLLAVQQILLQTHLHSLARSGHSGAAASGTSHGPESQGGKSEIESAIPSDVELDSAEPIRPSDPRRKARRMRMRELRIVQERALITDGGDGWPGRRLDWGVLLS